MHSIYHLKGTVKHYDWGGFSFIPALLRMKNPDPLPFAEYWLGTHSQDNCMIELPGGASLLLRDYITGELPFLLKVLDVKNMLSIQVHPSKSAAEIEFARENAEGIPLHSPLRNYKDDNHKPELMVALGDFWLLHGFKPAPALTKILKNIPEFNELLHVFEQSGYKGLYESVMKMPQEQVNAILEPLIGRIMPLYENGELDKSSEDFWAARAAITFQPPGGFDRGIFSIYFFNLLQLKKGQAVFQDAGLPHAYLEGQNVEIMASSDNVLRGGLTNKHIDVPELLKHIKCEPTHPQITEGEKINHEIVYRTPVPDFQLSVFELKKDSPGSFTPVTAEILLLTEGNASIKNKDQVLKLKKGLPSAIVFPGESVALTAAIKATVFRASSSITGA